MAHTSSELKSLTPSPSAILEQELAGAEVLQRSIVQLDSGKELAAAVTLSGDQLQLVLLTSAPGPLVLHWGAVARQRSQWVLPLPEWRPPGTIPFDDKAVQTPFGEWQQLRRLQINFPKTHLPDGIEFVLHRPAGNEWLKHQSMNLFIRINPLRETKGLPLLAQDIVEREMGEHGWTLMHRFNMCHELITRVHADRGGWTTLFVWLRFSAIRQLDWQRNYNTKPRELSHAQDRLTSALAQSWREQPLNRDLIRLSLTCIGRGGEGQRIRDEILQIMHRHHIKEVGGTWMEQWHQKLHNNTTLDDVAICEAYIAFLRAHGNRDIFYETLGAHGVTKERLASFDRPLTRDPEFIPHLRDVLITDFENYLKVLKAVHSATDMETAANAAGHLLNSSSQSMLTFIRHQFRAPTAPPRDLVAAVITVRKDLQSRLEAESAPGQLRELLYLDLALEDILRAAIERNIHTGLSGEELFDLMSLVLETGPAPAAGDELAQCRREWQRLSRHNSFDTDWSLHAKAAMDRLSRVIADGIDCTYHELQPCAEQLGRAFHAAEWAVRLFSEEVVRGRSAFVLSMLIRHLDPILRRSAKLGDWQVISPSTAIGRIEVFETVRELEGRRFNQPTIIIAEHVYGDEEPPEGVRAVITPSSVDLVSHVAVRARNANILFATCYERTRIDQLREMNGKIIELQVNASCNVMFKESTQPLVEAAIRRPAAAPKLKPGQAPQLRVVRMNDFTPGIVGGKSFHLKTLAEKLPGWIRTPRSIAIPFGGFEAVLASADNLDIATRYRHLLGEVRINPVANLPLIRKCIEELEIPCPLKNDVETALQAESMPLPSDWNASSTCISQVWASKWNNRAYFSRMARNWPDDQVQMAVLIQEVVAAEYAFVIHTVSPLSGNRDELYVEIVRGLGETLVGNYPGRAMSVVCSKTDGHEHILSYPAKNIGLFAEGLIFRSDSNAEDLEGYAGAGLYDSVLANPPRRVTLDYTGDKLVWDASFRAEHCGILTKIGMEVERTFGSPQDIEGAFDGKNHFVVQARPQVGL